MTVRKLKTLLFPLLFASGSMWAQQAIITVSVIDEDLRKPLADAFVAQNNGTPKATTPDGTTQITVHSFPVKLRVFAAGYEPAEQQLTDATIGSIRVQLHKRNATLDEVVVTGLSNPSKLKDAFAAYQVITAATMRAQGSVTAAEALRTQLNVNLGNDNMLGATTSMQGLKGDKVKILIDGMPVNGRENGQVDLGQIMTQNVQRIEIVQGPMSVVYGTDALGGVINIITGAAKKAMSLKTEGYYESIGCYNTNLTLARQFNARNQFTLGGGRNFFSGWKSMDPLNRSFLWLPKEQYFGNADYSYTAKSSFRLRFATDYVHEKLTNKASNYTITPFKAYALDNYYRTSRVNSRLSMNGKIGKQGVWQSQNSYALYYRTRNKYYKDLVTLEEQLVTGKGDNDTSRFDNFTFRGSYANKAKKWEYTIGYDINLEQGRSGKLDSTARTSIQDYAAYVSLSVPLVNDRLKLQPAVRYTHNTAYKAPLIPSLSALYSISQSIQLRFSYSRGFRAPSMKELYLHFYDSNHEVEGNRNLKAEHGDHLQASFSWTAYEAEGNYARLLTTAFYNDIYNQIGLLMPDPNRPAYAIYTNVDRMQNILGTLQAETQWHHLFAQGGITYMRILTNTGGAAANSYQATATIQYQWQRAGIHFSTFYKYFGRQPRLVNDVSGTSSYNGTINPYGIWDFSAERSFWKRRISLVAGLKNMLDVQTVNVAGATATGAHGGGTGGNNIAPGRSFFTSLRLSL